MKTYQLTRLYSLVMPVATKQGTTIVEFKGVQNMKMRGIFSTSNTELQNLLENSKEFKQKVFRLIANTDEPGASNGVPSANRQQPASNVAKKKPAPAQPASQTPETELF